MPPLNRGVRLQNSRRIDLGTEPRPRWAMPSLGSNSGQVAHSTSGARRGHTVGMKTAVSLPDRVYREAEGYARRTRKSRSQLYAEALAEYLARHAPDEVTEAM